MYLNSYSLLEISVTGKPKTELELMAVILQVLSPRTYLCHWNQRFKKEITYLV